SSLTLTTPPMPKPTGIQTFVRQTQNPFTSLSQQTTIFGKLSNSFPRTPGSLMTPQNFLPVSHSSVLKRPTTISCEMSKNSSPTSHVQSTFSSTRSGIWRKTTAWILRWQEHAKILPR
ncbi:hypothetical protein BGW38_010443, partial [Lunasporangiospora selenospora]